MTAEADRAVRATGAVWHGRVLVLTRELTARLAGRSEPAGGVAAFVEKREPRWTRA